jgi:hypothetical protein
MVVAHALDVPRAIVRQAQEWADMLGSLSELCEQRAALFLAGSLRGGRLLAFASSEHDPSWCGSRRHAAAA